MPPLRDQAGNREHGVKGPVSRRKMTRQEKNEQFLLSSFLYGGNAAYIEDLYSRYQSRPAEHRPDLVELASAGLPRIAPPTSPTNAQGPSWARADWPEAATGELVSAPDGNWGEIVVKTEGALDKKAAARRRARADSRRRAAGDARFHPRHHDDPRLSYARPSACRSRSADAQARSGPGGARSARATVSPRPITTARSSSTTCSGSRFATIPRDARDPEAHLLLRRVGVEFMHISDPEARAVDPGAHGRARTRRSRSRRRASSAILKKLIEAEGFEKFLHLKHHRHQALRPGWRRTR